MKPHHKSTHQQKAESGQQHTVQQGPREFTDADDMIRFDASNAIVPPEVAQRLQRSLGPAQVPWWKRLFGG